MINQSEYRLRRARVMEAMGPDSIAFIAAAPTLLRNGDTEFPYRQNSDFWYLTGFDEPEAVLVLVPGRKEGQAVLFNRPKDPTQEVWTGYRVGQAGAVKNFGVDQSFFISDFSF